LFFKDHPGGKMATATASPPTVITGIAYFYPKAGTVLTAREGKVALPLSEIPIPLLKEDFSPEEPSYDAVGRGIYHLLRANPDAVFADRYAALLRDAYPHLLAELATHLVMLDKKDVDLPYLDRKITYLKVFSLLEPENPRFPLEIGATYFDKGMTLAALGNTTLHFFSAEKFLRKAYQLSPDDVQIRYMLGDVCYILGKYQDTAKLWNGLIDGVNQEAGDRIRTRAAAIASGTAPAVPAIDYLQAVGVALEAYEADDCEEAAAILLDVMEAVSGYDEFPRAEINYLLGLCYLKLDIPKYAEQYLREALLLRPGYTEAALELQNLGVTP
jgi:tetratricopeptide (TPR) repeat protein